MIHDFDRARTNPRRRNLAPLPRSSFSARARRVRRSTRATLAICTAAALFAGPLRADAGELTAPPPTLPESEAPAAGPGTSAPVMAPAPAPTMAPAPAPAAGTPAAGTPRVDNQLSLQGRALWDGLQDQRVSLKLINGAELEGTIVAHSSRDLALARSSDGSVVSVPKAEVATVRTRAGASTTSSVALGNRPIDSGRSLHSAGVALLSFGVPFGVAGTVWLGLCASCLYIHLPLLLPGIGMIVGGSIALKRAKKRNEAFRQAWGIPLAGRVRMMPSLALSRGGGEVGFALRF